MAQESRYYLMITALTSASNSCNSETSGGQKHVRSKAPGWESSPMAKGQIKSNKEVRKPKKEKPKPPEKVSVLNPAHKK